MWKGLHHEHVLELRGIAEDVIDGGQLCMVIPWMENGNLRDYLRSIQAKKVLSSDELVTHVDLWVSILHLGKRILAYIVTASKLYQAAQGLAYLHSEGIVHGDLHAGNLLVDENSCVHIADFGLSVLADASAYNYGSKEAHGGGATRFTAPELLDSDEFNRDNRRPTRESDIFSFSFTCTEVMRHHLPP